MLAKKFSRFLSVNRKNNLQSISFLRISKKILLVTTTMLSFLNLNPFLPGYSGEFRCFAEKSDVKTIYKNNSDISSELFFYQIELVRGKWTVVRPDGIEPGGCPGIKELSDLSGHESISHIDHHMEALLEQHPENIDRSLGFPRLKFRSYRNLMSGHLRDHELANHRVCFRGDSRAPGVIWKEGGFWTIRYNEFYKKTVKGNREYSVMLHQSTPGTQDVVSTSLSCGVAKRFSIPVLKNSGFNYALWSGEGIGVSLAAVNQSRGTLSWNHIRDKVLRDECEVAFPGGIPRTYLLGARQTFEIKTKDQLPHQSQVIYGSKSYINRQLLSGVASDFGPDPEVVLKETVAGLFEVSGELATEIIESLREQIFSGYYDEGESGVSF